jgi:hypothetical protein
LAGEHALRCWLEAGFGGRIRGNSPEASSTVREPWLRCV